MEANGTAIIYFGDLEGGTEATVYLCMKKGSPYKLIDGDKIAVKQAVVLLSNFIEDRGIHVLNVAGPRATSKPQAYGYAHAVVEGLLPRLRR